MAVSKLCSVLLIALVAGLCAQSKDAYDQTDGKKGGLLDPAKFSIHHSLNFGMGAGMGSSMQSQGLYATLLTYQFSQPLTLTMNFGFPLYSTFSPYQNLNQQNLTSTQYFKNMPLDFSMLWKPSNNLLFQLNVVRNPQFYDFSGMNSPFYYQPFPMRMEEPLATK